jgi:hypothetical protein
VTDAASYLRDLAGLKGYHTTLEARQLAVRLTLTQGEAA